MIFNWKLTDGWGHQQLKAFRKHDRGLTLFATFRYEFQLQSSWPPSLDQVVQFVAYMSVKDLAWSTARTYLMGIAFQCKVSGCLDITHFLSRNYLKVLGGQPMRRISDFLFLLHLKQLLAILPAICRDNYEAKMFSAAFTLAFVCALTSWGNYRL